jgi:GTP-binding protein
VTRANPKIGDYPFTTLEPSLGVAELNLDTTLVMADIPGLVEGAHEGVGLGVAFLRHIQRTRVLIHMLDGLSEDPLADFTQTNSELAYFDPQLAKKPQLVALNKIDLPEVQQRWPAIKAALEERGYQPMAISAMARTNLEPLLWKVLELLQTAPVFETEAEIPVYRPEEDIHDFVVTREPKGWRVSGKGIQRSAEMTYWEHDGSLRRFQRLMEKIGVDEALRAAGIQEGETVFIGDYELEWQD